MSLDLSSVATQLLGSLASNADGYIVLRRETGGLVDPITGDYTSGETEDYDLVGAVTAISDALVDGTRIQSGDVMVTVDNQIAPAITDTLLINDVEHQIVPPIRTVSHAGTVQVYKIQARL
jgi:hypothetical protein